MVKSAQKASTQKFTEIHDIVDDIVVLDGQSACSIIEVQATNFALLSLEEQQTKIYAYASLLNSLSFPIQVLIRNKKVNISAYLKQIDLEMQKTLSAPNNNQSEKLIDYIRKYRDFVAEMVKINSVLDKKFYLIISFSALEKGIKSVLGKEGFVNQAKAGLHTKADSLLTQLSRLSLPSRILEKEALIKLFYEIYNEEASDENQISENLKTPIVRMKGTSV
ncbi:hypothetical protein C4559_01435 [Candidatus Microgenomates bacterium]|nr:MAG: hypothetical protein C4559_01435 [Candidatus Microgenomates bacterium]